MLNIFEVLQTPVTTGEFKLWTSHKPSISPLGHMVIVDYVTSLCVRDSGQTLSKLLEFVIHNKNWTRHH